MSRGRFLLVAFVLAFGFLLGKGYLVAPNIGPNPVDLSNLSGKYDATNEVGVFEGKKVASKFDVTLPSIKNVLGTSNGPKRIEVDINNQRLYAFEGDQKVYDFPVSTGKWGRTPTGTFTIANKLRYKGMSGGNPALGTYYNLPNVPFVMFFGNREIPWSVGFSIHGTYWHNNFGHPMSHGCVNMRTEDVEKIFYWAEPDLQGQTSISANNSNPGTPVIVYGVTPEE